VRAHHITHRQQADQFAAVPAIDDWEMSHGKDSVILRGHKPQKDPEQRYVYAAPRLNDSA
jgi:hypothetical protein